MMAGMEVEEFGGNGNWKREKVKEAIDDEEW